MEEHKIEPLFSIPLYSSKLKRELNKQENDFIFNHTSKVVQNRGGNYMSYDNKILNNENLKELKEFFLTHINNYFDKIIQTNNSFSI